MEAAIGLEVGFTFTLTVAGLFYLGFKADEHFGTKPLWSFVGFGVGLMLGFYNLYLTLDAAAKREKARREAKRPSSNHTDSDPTGSDQSKDDGEAT
jgi:F0F1-type ATP synthase assembly protein I